MARQRGPIVTNFNCLLDKDLWRGILGPPGSTELLQLEADFLPYTIGGTLFRGSRGYHECWYAFGLVSWGSGSSRYLGKMARASLSIEALIALLCEDSRTPVSERLKEAGLGEEQVAALCANPETARKVFQAATQRYLVPVIPAILRALGKKAEAGNPAAQASVLGLLGDKSPIREAAGRDMGSLDEKTFGAYVAGLVERLTKFADSGRGGEGA